MTRFFASTKHDSNTEASWRRPFVTVSLQLPLELSAILPLTGSADWWMRGLNSAAGRRRPTIPLDILSSRCQHQQQFFQQLWHGRHCAQTRNELSINTFTQPRSRPPAASSVSTPAKISVRCRSAIPLHNTAVSSAFVEFYNWIKKVISLHTLNQFNKLC